MGWVPLVALLLGIVDGWSWDVLMVCVCGVGLVAAAGLGAALGAWVVPEMNSFVGFALAAAGAVVLEVVDYVSIELFGVLFVLVTVAFAVATRLFSMAHRD